jgi:hypothetical protein
MVGGEAALAIRDFVGETFGEVPGGFNALPGREGRLPTVRRCAAAGRSNAGGAWAARRN